MKIIIPSKIESQEPFIQVTKRDGLTKFKVSLFSK